MAASIDSVQWDMAVDKLDVNGHWLRHAFALVAITDGADDDGAAAAAVVDAAADGDAAAVGDGAVAGRPLPNADFDS